MSELAIIMYTHTDVKDVWPAFFGQTDKYLPDFKKYIFVNKDDEDIPSDYEKVYYDDKKIYRERLIKCLLEIDDEFIMYNHEDMFLYDKPNTDKLIKYLDKINDNAPFIRLMRGGGGVGTPDGDFPELKRMNGSIEYIFAIQPTIWKRTKLIQLLKESGGDTIWTFEVEAQHVCRQRNMMGYYLDDGGKKRGQMHWDTKGYPYVATAISKGSWNTLEYPKELKEIADTYNIDLSKRGTNG